jgi:hypothetical protein
MHVKRVSWHREPETAEGRLYALVTPNPTDGSFDAEVVDGRGNVYVRLEGYRTATLAAGIDAEALKPLQAVLASETADAAND